MRRADLDTLLIAVYCAACSLFPSPRPRRRRDRCGAHGVSRRAPLGLLRSPLRARHGTMLMLRRAPVQSVRVQLEVGLGDP